jgi:glycosyltransferase involved in cell wall biosynthesis
LLSIIIPSRNERYLNKTVEDILSKAKGEIEIAIVLDGYWPDEMLVNDKRIVIIHRGISRGMRSAINSGVSIAKGEHVLKCDAHVMFDEGFDTKLIENCENNWVVVPRRKRLDAENWQIQDVGKPDVDYMYLSYPYTLDKNGKPVGLHGINWDERNKKKDLQKKTIDDLMSAQGSCWFMKKDYYNKLELMDEEHYGAFWSEFQEIGLKCWLSGGRVVVNKNTWYAHLHKKSRGYNLEASTTEAENYVMKWLTIGEAWGNKQTLPFEWLIEKFSPIPGWPQ